MNTPLSPVHKLYQRFYNNGNVIIDAAASSHWQECAKKFEVCSFGEEHIEVIAGYGFGTSGNSRLLSRLFNWIGNMVHLAYLGLPGLWQDVQKAKKVVKRMGLSFSQDAFRQVCTLNLLVRQMQTTQAPDRILIIGDGHGILSALIHTKFPAARIFLADLGSVLFFQSHHLHKAFPNAKQAITDEHGDVLNNAVFNLCPADSLDTFPKDDLDLAINVASMQEMDPTVTACYFDLLRQRNTRLFYCCNRLEKRLPGGEVARFMDFPWSLTDEYLVDSPCPWHQWFFGLGWSPSVKVWGVPVPLMHRYAGVHWHRLARFRRTE